MPSSFFGGGFFGGEFWSAAAASAQPGGPIGVLVPLKPYRGPGYRKPLLKSEIEPARESWEERLQREYRFNNPQVIPVIGRVAAHQADDLGLDRQARFEQLERALELQGVEWDARYWEALNLRREQLIDQEIGRLLKRKLEEEEGILLMLLAAI